MILRTLVSLLAIALLAGCGGSDDSSSKVSPARTLAAAKQHLDEASSWRISLKTDAKPQGNGVLAAEGVGTHAPAWKGNVKVMFSGIEADVPVTAMDGKLYAKLPFTSRFAPINPQDYGAPDPADFMDTDKGISSMLTSLKEPRESGTARAGGQVVTSYQGTLAGTDVARIIPSASKQADYPTTVNINDEGQLTSVSITGPFFAGSADVTYDMTISDYGKEVTINRP